MKVEIITLHRITNFGSMLQTYATQTAIEKLGHEAEVLDFVPEGMSFKRANWPKNDTPAWKKLLKLPSLFVVNLIEYHDVTDFYENTSIFLQRDTLATKIFLRIFLLQKLI